ncbi:unnamed protein product [Dracunculus medinensis]|uniref:BolA-like protein 1 n=1 Tax=Dracunculus medinensis TaxID=318479 RepID=A0A0N4UDF9_DRAME|nr:unnamed protein product [Dracunculus medinensis]
MINFLWKNLRCFPRIYGESQNRFCTPFDLLCAISLQQPTHLVVECESDIHGSSVGTERHFSVLIVSDAFEGLKNVEIHRRIYECLQSELNSGVHALRLDAYPKSKYDKVFSSPPPPCSND